VLPDGVFPDALNKLKRLKANDRDYPSGMSSMMSMSVNENDRNNNFDENWRNEVEKYINYLQDWTNFCMLLFLFVFELY
jgi:hypothetical protein